MRWLRRKDPDNPLHEALHRLEPAEHAMHKALSMTDKFATNAEADCEDADDGETIRICTTIKGAFGAAAPDSSIPKDIAQRFDASFGGDPTPPGDYIQEALDATAAILADDSQCAKWFGPAALTALAKFGEQLRNAEITRLKDSATGIDQRHPNAWFDKDGRAFVSSRTSPSPAFRLFETVRINTIGPFHSLTSLSPKIGGYANGSLGSRITQILHELAHLVYYPDSANTLIDDDGADTPPTKSPDNTDFILNNEKTKCKDAINSYLRNGERRQE